MTSRVGRLSGIGDVQAIRTSVVQSKAVDRVSRMRPSNVHLLKMLWSRGGHGVGQHRADSNRDPDAVDGCGLLLTSGAVCN